MYVQNSLEYLRNKSLQHSLHVFLDGLEKAQNGGMDITYHDRQISHILNSSQN